MKSSVNSDRDGRIVILCLTLHKFHKQLLGQRDFLVLPRDSVNSPIIRFTKIQRKHLDLGWGGVIVLAVVWKRKADRPILQYEVA